MIFEPYPGGLGSKGAPGEKGSSQPFSPASCSSIGRHTHAAAELVTAQALLSWRQKPSIMADSWAQLTSDLDRFTQSRGSTALLYGAAAGFLAGGLFGTWLSSRRRRAPATQDMHLSNSGGAPRHPNAGLTFSAPPSELGSLPVTPRGSDEHDQDVKMVLVVRQDLKMVRCS